MRVCTSSNINTATHLSAGGPSPAYPNGLRQRAFCSEIYQKYAFVFFLLFFGMIPLGATQSQTPSRAHLATRDHVQRYNTASDRACNIVTRPQSSASKSQNLDRTKLKASAYNPPSPHGWSVSSCTSNCHIFLSISSTENVL